MNIVDTIVVATIWLIVFVGIVATVIHSRNIVKEATYRPPEALPGDATDPGSEVVVPTGFDPLDAAGTEPSVFTGKTHECDWTAVAAKWATLPMYADKAKLAKTVQSLEQNNVTMLVSGTGSGKTVIMPKLAHRILREKLPKPSAAEALAMWVRGERQKGSVVAVTNPKQLTTVSNAKYSAELACVALGREIGYRHRDSPASAVSSLTQLEYVTDGYLLSVAKTDPDFTDYGVVIIDEAHERPVPTDFLMLALKRAMERRPELRVVVMSATMDTTPFVKWFGEGGLKVGDLSVSGKPNYPIDRIYDPLVKGQTYLTKAVDVILNLQKSPDSTPGGILVFVPATADTLNGCAMLLRACTEAGLECTQEPGTDGAELKCMRLYSGVSDEDKEAAVSPSLTKATRHVVFSTNVAESSLTVEDLSYVIDSGQVFRVEYDAVNDVTRAGKQTITKAEATQRMGRVGRRRPGKAILLYPEFVFDKMKPEPPPSISSVNVTDQLFELMASSEFTWAETDAEARALLTPPSDAQLSIARVTLEFYGIIDSDGSITEVGRAVHELYKSAKTSFDYCLLLFAARLSGSERPASRVLACLEAKALPWLAASLKGRFQECGASDHVTALRAFEAGMKHARSAMTELNERAIELEKAAMAFTMPQEVARTSPWIWLAAQQDPWKVLTCSFSSNNTRCTATGSPIKLQKCDEFFRAILVANLMRSVHGGKRIFGSDNIAALGSVTTESIESAVFAGHELLATGDTTAVQTFSTAFAMESVDPVLKSLSY